MPDKSMDKIMKGVDKVAAKLSEEDKMEFNQREARRESTRKQIMKNKDPRQLDKWEIHDEASERDQADIKKLKAKTNVWMLDGKPIVPVNSKEYGKPVSDIEKMRSAEAAEREHLDDSLYGGLDEARYNRMQKEAKKLRAKHKVPNQDPNKKLRDTKEARDKAYYGSFK